MVSPGMEAPRRWSASSQVVQNGPVRSIGRGDGRHRIVRVPRAGRDILTPVARAGWRRVWLAVLLASLAGWLAAGRITAPIHALAQTASRMAEGDLTACRMRAGKFQDELGQMARSSTAWLARWKAPS